MNWQGWIFMLIVWGIVGCLFFYSFYRILFDERVGNKIVQNNTGQKKRKKRSRD
jgi:Na+/melibiose symporter-like transporter